MGRAHVSLNNFTGGAISPRLYGRWDIEKYSKACKVLENFMVWAHGGITKRPGSYYIATTKASGAARLIPFIYNSGTSYVLEFGDEYLRFYTNGGQVQSGGSAYEISTPYQDTDLWGIKYVQIGDTMYLVHPSYAPRKLVRYDATNWQLVEVTFAAPAFRDENKDTNWEITPSATTGNITLTTSATLISNGTFDSDIAGWDDVSYDTGRIEWGALGTLRILNSDGTDPNDEGQGNAEQDVAVVAGTEYRLSFDIDTHSTTSGFMVRIGTTSCASDIAYVSYPNTASGTKTITFTVPDGVSLIYIGFLIIAVFYADELQIDNVSLLKSAGLFTTADVGEYIKLAYDAVERKETVTVSGAPGAGGEWTTALTVNAGSLNLSISGTWVGTVTLQRSYDSGSTWFDHSTYTGNATLVITEASATVQFRVGIKNGEYTSGAMTAFVSQVDDNPSGYAQITAYTSETVVDATVISDFPTTDATYRWSRGAWNATNGYPRAIAWYEQRLIFAGTTAQPQNIWASKVGSYEDLTTGLNDDDGWTYQLASEQGDAILWLFPTKVLHVGTISGEWHLGTATEALTATNPSSSKDTTYGSADISPLNVARVLLSVQKFGRKLRGKTYDYRTDDWPSADLSILAEHLFLSGVVSIAWANQPDPYLFLVMEDGTINQFAYNPDQEVAAFSVWTTDGDFEDVCVVPGTDRDEIWVVVNRTINSAVVRYVEQFQSVEWTDQEDAFHVDAGITYDGAADATLTGLGHLEGETVAVFAEGGVLPSVAVSSSGVTLARAVTLAHMGLPFTAKMQTTSIEAPASGGTAQGRQQRMFKVMLRVVNSLGFKVGSALDKLETLSFRGMGDDMGAPPTVFTGDKRTELQAPDDERAAHVFVVSDQPVPVSLSALVITTYAAES